MMIQLLGIVNCFFYLLYTYYCGVVIFKQKTTFHIKYIIAVILFIAGFYLTLYYFSPFFSIFFTYAIYVLFYKIIFHKSWMQTLAGALVVYIIRVFFEFLFILIGWEIKDTVYTCHVYSMPKFYLNLFTCLISFLTVVFLKNI